MTCQICGLTVPDEDAYNPNPNGTPAGPTGHRACVDPLPEHNHAEPASPDWRTRAGLTG